MRSASSRRPCCWRLSISATGRMASPSDKRSSGVPGDSSLWERFTHRWVDLNARGTCDRRHRVRRRIEADGRNATSSYGRSAWPRSSSRALATIGCGPGCRPSCAGPAHDERPTPPGESMDVLDFAPGRPRGRARRPRRGVRGSNTAGGPTDGPPMVLAPGRGFIRCDARRPG